jgi:hypothetical protein
MTNMAFVCWPCSLEVIGCHAAGLLINCSSRTSGNTYHPIENPLNTDFVRVYWPAEQEMSTYVDGDAGNPQIVVCETQIRQWIMSNILWCNALILVRSFKIRALVLSKRMGLFFSNLPSPKLFFFSLSLDWNESLYPYCLSTSFSVGNHQK